MQKQSSHRDLPARSQKHPIVAPSAEASEKRHHQTVGTNDAVEHEKRSQTVVLNADI